MKTDSLTHEEIARRAYKIWQENGSPSGRDNEIWLEAEQQLTAGSPESGSNSKPQADHKSNGTSAMAERVKGEMASESAVEHHISPPIPEQEAIKAALQKHDARAPRNPTKTAPKAHPTESGKPLWNQPHSS